MKEQAKRFQDYTDDEIIETGVPQFDFYSQKERLLNREEFCKRLGLDPKKKIILYGSAGGNDCWDDPGYLKLIRSYIEHGELHGVQVLIRPHLGVKGDYERYTQFEKILHFVVDTTDEQNNMFKDRGDFSSEGHINHLFNSLYHADVCPNMVSTLTLDCLTVGTPVINMDFDPVEKVDPQKSAKRLWAIDYARAVLDFGWAWHARNKEEFLKALKEILSLQDKKNYREEKRREMIEYFIHKNDGGSAERIAEALIKIINN